ncbi:MAG TPA: LytTR family transcriptional regulator DNA-binding domain-containing protein [Gammaproteobacteria bacterium]|jgi:PAS domain S-box-containing protein|nr:LytTR family transcriptional regulator DNA-binding domain-containing protein [Gammaproteobacteria bacterium]
MYQSTLDGRFIDVDPLFADMLGYGSSQELVENIRDIGAQLYVDQGVRLQLVEQLLEHGGVCNFEAQVYRKNGEVLWVSEYARAVRGSDGSVSRFQGAFADISSYKGLLKRQAELNHKIVDGLDGLRRSVNGAGRSRIPVKDGTRVKFMDVTRITYVRADGDYVHVYTEGGKHVMARDRISCIERRLDSPAFARISKSVMLNVNYVKELRSRRRGGYEFVMDCGALLSSGPTYREVVRKILDELKEA